MVVLLDGKEVDFPALEDRRQGFYMGLCGLKPLEASSEQYLIGYESGRDQHETHRRNIRMEMDAERAKRLSEIEEDDITRGIKIILDLSKRGISASFTG